MILNTKNKIIINIVVLFLVVFTIIYFIIIPAMADIAQIKKTIYTQRVKLESDYLKGQNLKKILKQIKEVKNQNAILDQVFVKKNNGLEFVEILEKIAKDSKITQKIDLPYHNFNEKNKTYEKIPIQFFTTGDFIDQLNYLIDLETLNYYINIKSLDIAFNVADNQEENKASNVNMMVVADTYWK